MNKEGQAVAGRRRLLVVGQLRSEGKSGRDRSLCLVAYDHIKPPHPSRRRDGLGAERTQNGNSLEAAEGMQVGHEPRLVARGL